MLVRNLTSFSQILLFLYLWKNDTLVRKNDKLVATLVYNGKNLTELARWHFAEKERKHLIISCIFEGRDKYKILSNIIFFGN